VKLGVTVVRVGYTIERRRTRLAAARAWAAPAAHRAVEALRAPWAPAVSVWGAAMVGHAVNRARYCYCRCANGSKPRRGSLSAAVRMGRDEGQIRGTVPLIAEVPQSFATTAQTSA
jgi:hypothetical protein